MLSGEPDAGNLHVRFVEGRVGRSSSGSPSLLLYRLFLCAEHVRQLEGGSPFDNLMEVKS